MSITYEEIDTLTGELLDAAVAETVLGHTVDEHRVNFRNEEAEEGFEVWECIPFYSSDIAAAFSVADAMDERCCGVEFRHYNRGPDLRCTLWHVCFRPGKDTGWGEMRGTSLPETICRAALKAVLAPSRAEAAIAALRQTPTGALLEGTK